MTGKRSLLAALGLTAALGYGVVQTTTPAAAAGLLKPVGSNDSLTIKDHDIRVVLEDGYATTTIEQSFENLTAQDLEAIYAFPVPEHAAVAEFTYWIDGKPVTAEVMKRAEARQLYENEKAANRETALAEQDGYKRFEMSVWPVKAQDDVRIRLTYIQPVKLDGGVGRYAYPLEEGGVDDPLEQSFWTFTDDVTGRFSFDMTLRTAYPIDGLRIPTHPQAQIQQETGGVWRVSIQDGHVDVEDPNNNQTSATALNQDLVVYWRQPTNLPGSLDIIANKAEADGRGTFMAVFTPGDDLVPITTGRDWTFIVDRSGSMHGKFATLLNGLERALKSLPEQDRFRIVLFNDTAVTAFSGYQTAGGPAVGDMIAKAAAWGPQGGTNLYAGLEMGLRDLDADRPHGVVLITDGVANVGRTQRKDFIDLAAANDVRLFTVVMGNSANRPLLEHLADASGGHAISVSNSDDITGRLMTATTSLSHYAFTDLSLSIDGVKTADITPQVPAALHRGQQLVVFGHYWKGGPATFTLTGRTADKAHEYKVPLTLPKQADLNPEIERLWAFSSIEHMMRQRALLGADQDSEDGITGTAIEYGLLTPFTSMVVVREDIFANLGIDRTNQKRLETEKTAQTARRQNPPTVTSTQIAGTPRAHVSNGGGANGSGAAGPLLIGLLAFLRRIVRRDQRAHPA